MEEEFERKVEMIIENVVLSQTILKMKYFKKRGDTSLSITQNSYQTHVDALAEKMNQKNSLVTQLINQFHSIVTKEISDFQDQLHQKLEFLESEIGSMKETVIKNWQQTAQGHSRNNSFLEIDLSREETLSFDDKSTKEILRKLKELEDSMRKKQYKNDNIINLLMENSMQIKAQLQKIINSNLKNSTKLKEEEAHLHQKIEMIEKFEENQKQIEFKLQVLQQNFEVQLNKFKGFLLKYKFYQEKEKFHYSITNDMIQQVECLQKELDSMKNSLNITGFISSIIKKRK